MNRAARIALAVFALAWTAAWAPTATGATAAAEALYRQSLAATCANCHGTDGRVPPGVAWDGLAGMPQAVLVERMRAFKAGTRPSTVMQQLARGYSDAQIDALAAYFAALPK